uniref:Chitin-binding type-2 domain-containing protein n=1 Tax=Arion vulgaris TaxID=1028688 RepID=A0A0B7ATF5_9EUPU
MTLSGIAIICSFMLFAWSNGQLSSRTQTTCNVLQASAGDGFYTDGTYCQVFHQCSGSSNYTYICPAGTLRNSNNMVCDYQISSTCEYWPCSSTTGKLTYPGVCREQYFECNGTGFVSKTCPTGLTFNIASGQCMLGGGTDHALCQRSNATGDNSTYCRDKPHRLGDPCQYAIDMGNNTFIDNRPCPPSTSYNSTTCACTNINDACPKSTNKTRSKYPDILCRASFVLGFSVFNVQTGAPQVTSEKDASNLPDFVEAVGVTFSNGQAMLSTNAATRAESSLYIYSFNGNELTPGIGFIFLFRSFAATTTPVQILVNDYHGACVPTVEFNATYSGSVYSFTYSVVGMTRHSTKNTTNMSDILTASLPVPIGSFIEMAVFFDSGLPLTIKLTDKGANGVTNGAVQQVTGNTALGSTIAANKCGYSLFRGLNGIAQSFIVHEACRNSTIFLSK